MSGEWLASGWRVVGECSVLASGWRVVGEWLASGWRVVGEWLASGWRVVGEWLASGWRSGLGLTVVVYGSPSCFINLPIVF